MKKILLLCVLILGISCTTSEKELQEEPGTELNAKLADLGEGSWYSYETINGVEYTVVNGLKAKEIIAIADGSCETCRAKCSYVRNLGDGAHLVNCDNGHSYYAVNCGSGWSVTLADVTSSDGGQVGNFPMPPRPCS